MTTDIDGAFSDRGKTYRGVRYEDGTIRTGIVVSVVPEDGQSYELTVDLCRNVLPPLSSSFEWGVWFNAMGKIPEHAQKSIYEDKATYIVRTRKRSDADWKRLEIHQKKCKQLAISILYDLTGNGKVAAACYEKFSARVIEKLPEAAWTLTVEQIEEAVGAEMVLAALGSIGEK